METAGQSFDTLRATAIAAAELTSGKIWTDYNLHDPGVTLLEQIVFALSEVSYRSTFPVRDLLTQADGTLDFDRLGLAAPEVVLPMAPVTAEDLALALSTDLPGVARTMLYPAGDGLYDAYVIPAPGHATAEACAGVRAAFDHVRALCEDLRSLTPARAIPCRLTARVALTRRDQPERAAARIYAACDRLMRDDRGPDPSRAATRADLFADPARAHGPPPGSATAPAGYEQFFSAISALESVEDVPGLSFTSPDGDGDPFAVLPRGSYRRLARLTSPADLDLTLTHRGKVVAYDFNGLCKELARLEADALATRTDRLDRADFDVLAPGTPRQFPTLPVGHTLPQPYLAGPGPVPPSADPPTRRAAEHLRGYLALADAAIAMLNRDLATLPELYSAGPETTRSYALDPPEIAEAQRLSPATAVTAALRVQDPWRDRRTRMLDRLLALYGEEMPAIGPDRLAPDHGVAAQAEAPLRARIRLLRRVPDLHRDRAMGPRLATLPRPPLRGFVEKLALLLDMRSTGGPHLTAPLRRSGLTIVPPGRMDGVRPIPPESFGHAGDPLEMFVPRDDAAAPLPPGAAWFLRSGKITANALRHGVRQDAYLRRRQADGCWRLVLDAGEDGLLPCGLYSDPHGAAQAANGLRAGFAALNRRCEGFYLVESTLLRDPDGPMEPMTVTVVAPRWTARTADAEFRAMVEDLARDLCPAHLHLRVLWLAPAPMHLFEHLHACWRFDRATGRDRGFRTRLRNALPRGDAP
ncbi:MAG: hypothetical protein AAFQ51_08110 [Pseudomonadota bacterium]